MRAVSKIHYPEVVASRLIYLLPEFKERIGDLYHRGITSQNELLYEVFICREAGKLIGHFSTFENFIGFMQKSSEYKVFEYSKILDIKSHSLNSLETTEKLVSAYLSNKDVSDVHSGKCGLIGCGKNTGCVNTIDPILEWLRDKK